MKKRLIISLATSFVVAATAVIIASPAQAAITNVADGFDVSWAQCGTTLPTPGAFSIIDVDGGRAFSANACLVDQLNWAKTGGRRIELYVNTGNPGGPVINENTQTPASSSPLTISNWPSNPGAIANPRLCVEDPTTTTIFEADTVDCAYDYGYRAAHSSFTRASAAFLAAGLSYKPSAVNWWLDLEIAFSWTDNANTWRGYDPGYTHPNDVNLVQADFDARNQASLQGAHDYLVNVAKVRQLGLYGSPHEWDSILHGNLTVFRDHPFWYPIGAADRSTALATCTSFTNVTGSGAPVMVQFVDQTLGLDTGVRCKPTTRVRYTGNSRVARNARITIAMHLTAAQSGVALHGQPVRFRLNGVTYRGVTNAKGDVSMRIRAPRYRGTYKLDSFYDGNSYAGSSTRVNLVVR
jgi:hypothetical protein